MSDIDEIAAAIAARANDCCCRSDGWEEAIKEFVIDVLNAGYKHKELAISVKFTPEELAQMQIDAMRYRWLRDSSGENPDDFDSKIDFQLRVYNRTEGYFL